MSEVDRILGALQAEADTSQRHRAELFDQLDEIKTFQAGCAGCLPGIKNMLQDHEKRLRVQEKEGHKRVGRAGALGAAAGMVGTAATAIAAWFGLK